MTEPDYINLDTTAILVKKVIFSLPKFLNNYIPTSGYSDKYSFWVQEIFGSFSKSQSTVSNSPSVP